MEGWGGNPIPACSEVIGVMPTSPEFTIFIDGACPLCRREASLMARLDKGRGRLAFVDISAADFDAARYGTTLERTMATIHGLTADGRLVTGMEVFRRAYAAVGWGWVLAPTGWPVLRPVFDRLYAWFASRRLSLTGRGNACPTGACAVRPGSRAA